MSVGTTENGNEIEIQDYYFRYCEFSLTPSFRKGVGRRHLVLVLRNTSCFFSDAQILHRNSTFSSNKKNSILTRTQNT